MKPYTYLIKHKPTGKVYYGYRSAHKVEPEQDLWKKYFTSSPGVKTLIEETSINDFETQIRKVFNTKKEAATWEAKVLRRCKVLHDDKWLNQNILGYVVPTLESRKKISDFHKNKPKSKEHARKISKALKGQKHPWAAGNLPPITYGKDNPRYGTHHTKESAAKIGAANKIRMLEKGDAHHMKHVEWTDERRALMSKMGQSPRKPYPLKTCTYCGKECPTNLFKRWHGDNCKQR